MTATPEETQRIHRAAAIAGYAAIKIDDEFMHGCQLCGATYEADDRHDPDCRWSGPVGWLVLTNQVDGSWQPDWSGFMHATETAGTAELALAQTALGGEAARLVEVRPAGAPAYDEQETS